MGLSVARFLLPLCALLAACAPAPAGQGPTVVGAAAEGDGNSVEVTLSGSDLAADVWSERGIGAATFALTGGPPPSAILLRLHLRALEELRVTLGRDVIVVSVASGPGHAVSQRHVAPGGAEQQLAPGDDGWLPVAVVAPGPDPAFPLQEGHFAVTLPADAMAGADGGFRIEWVDFFR
jgi:hypothetical protein